MSTVKENIFFLSICGGGGSGFDRWDHGVNMIEMNPSYIVI